MKPPIISTFILVRDGLFREGLRLILSNTRFRAQSCGIEFDDLGAIPDDVPTLFIVGIGATRDPACKSIRTLYPLSIVVAVGDELNGSNVIAAIDDGANAALLNSISPSALVSVLHALAEGQLLIIDARLRSFDLKPEIEAPPLIHNETSEADCSTSQSIHLSARELAILDRIVRGDSNKHVARYFGIAEPTVKAHVKAIFRKIGANNRTQAAIWALNHARFENANWQPRSKARGKTVFDRPLDLVGEAGNRAAPRLADNFSDAANSMQDARPRRLA